MENSKWLQWAIELQSLAQAGLTYGKDKFDLERYTRIREISAEMMSRLSDTPMDTVKDLFCNESGYQTPKIDTRAAVFQDGKFCSCMKTTAHGRSPVAGAMWTSRWLPM